MTKFFYKKWYVSRCQFHQYVRISYRHKILDTPSPLRPWRHLWTNPNRVRCKKSELTTPHLNWRTLSYRRFDKCQNEMKTPFISKRLKKERSKYSYWWKWNSEKNSRCLMWSRLLISINNIRLKNVKDYELLILKTGGNPFVCKKAKII